MIYAKDARGFMKNAQLRNILINKIDARIVIAANSGCTSLAFTWSILNDNTEVPPIVKYQIDKILCEHGYATEFIKNDGFTIKWFPEI